MNQQLEVIQQYPTFYAIVGKLLPHVREQLLENIQQHLESIPEEYSTNVMYVVDLMMRITENQYIVAFEEERKTWNDRLDGFQRSFDLLQRSIAMQERSRKRTNGRGRPSGAKALEINKWAREQYAGGKTIDELLPEYAEQRKMSDLVQARELLRKAVKPRK